jgi:hypothetical protein
MKNIKDLKTFINEAEDWKIASDKLNALRGTNKEDTEEYFLAYADYYAAMAKLNGDSNGYYYSQEKDFRKKAFDSSDAGKVDKELREKYTKNIQEFFKNRLSSIPFNSMPLQELQIINDGIMSVKKRK